MHLEFRNVNDAFEEVVSGIADGTIPTVKTSSRVGDVLQITEPIIITYTRPSEKVLFNPRRDANCFFALYESLWMLAGRNDVAPLAYYNSAISDIASDDGETFNGAYGYRWRNSEKDSWVPDQLGSDVHCPHCGMGKEKVDQLDILINHLRENPNSRRAVLQMWNVEDDLLKIGSPVDYSKDVCCNVCAFFSISNLGDPERKIRCLDMTVINRSNDIVWGMMGANAVHFAFLQEYLANSLGVEVGVYNQISNNAHVYTERFTPEKWLKKPLTMWDPDPVEVYDSYYRSVPLVNDRERFDREVKKFVENYSGRDDIRLDTYEEPFLREVAQPMMYAFKLHKERDYPEAMLYVEQIGADDWRVAAGDWIDRRRKNWEAKSKGGTVE